MVVLLFTVLGAAAMVTGYAFGLGGPVGALLFGLFALTGALIRYARPLIDWITRPS